jgi:predicted enzyme related to lactoylglutathione lyase
MSKPVVHFEIGCLDTAKAATFYESLFGWSTSQMGPARMIETGAAQGIQGHFTALGHEPHHYTIFYVEVEDIGAHLSKAGELGGKVIVPKVDIPNYGSFAWFADPEGNTIGLWTPASRQGENAPV